MGHLLGKQVAYPTVQVTEGWTKTLDSWKAFIMNCSVASIAESEPHRSLQLLHICEVVSKLLRVGVFGYFNVLHLLSSHLGPLIV